MEFSDLISDLCEVQSTKKMHKKFFDPEVPQSFSDPLEEV